MPVLSVFYLVISTDALFACDCIGLICGEAVSDEP